MLFKNTEFEIKKTDPFANDCLDRKTPIINLSKILIQISGPFVMSIESKWGSGKTTFINMWKTVLENDGYICLYFNAWKADFSEDPLLTFINEMQDLSKIEKFKNRDKDIIDVLKSIQEKGGKVIKKSIPLILEILSHNILDSKIIDDGISGKISDLLSQLATERIQLYEAEKRSIVEFKETLGSLKECLKQQGVDKPVIFFIDELDRCRPDYAVVLLERIKHLFDLNGFIFILSIDRMQIENSIKAQFGSGIDTDGYLRRFIDLSYTLPNPSKKNFCKFLIEKYGFPEFFRPHPQRYSNYVIELYNAVIIFTDIFDLSLRKIEQCIGQIAASLSFVILNDDIYIDQIAFLVFLRTINSDLYNDIFNKKTNISNILDILKKYKMRLDHLEYYFSRIEPFLAFYLYSDNEIESHLKLLEKDCDSLSNNPILKRIYEKRKDRFVELKDFQRNNLFLYIFPMVNFTSDIS